MLNEILIFIVGFMIGINKDAIYKFLQDHYSQSKKEEIKK